MSAGDFKVGDRVLYVPNHANGDAKHPDCERGIVSSTNEVNVFVRYTQRGGDLSVNGQATSPENLIKR